MSKSSIASISFNSVSEKKPTQEKELPMTETKSEKSGTVVDQEVRMGRGDLGLDGRRI